MRYILPVHCISCTHADSAKETRQGRATTHMYTYLSSQCEEDLFLGPPLSEEGGRSQGYHVTGKSHCRELWAGITPVGSTRRDMWLAWIALYDLKNIILKQYPQNWQCLHKFEGEWKRFRDSIEQACKCEGNRAHAQIHTWIDSSYYILVNCYLHLFLPLLILVSFLSHTCITLLIKCLTFGIALYWHKTWLPYTCIYM